MREVVLKAFYRSKSFTNTIQVFYRYQMRKERTDHTTTSNFWQCIEGGSVHGARQCKENKKQTKTLRNYCWRNNQEILFVSFSDYSSLRWFREIEGENCITPICFIQNDRFSKGQKSVVTLVNVFVPLLAIDRPMSTNLAQSRGFSSIGFLTNSQ